MIAGWPLLASAGIDGKLASLAGHTRQRVIVGANDEAIPQQVSTTQANPRKFRGCCASGGALGNPVMIVDDPCQLSWRSTIINVASATV